MSSTKYPQEKARDYAERHGYQRGPGGWIYSPDGKPVAQGWADLYHKFRQAIEAEAV